MTLALPRLLAVLGHTLACSVRCQYKCSPLLVTKLQTVIQIISATINIMHSMLYTLAMTQATESIKLTVVTQNRVALAVCQHIMAIHVPMADAVVVQVFKSTSDSDGHFHDKVQGKCLP